jgi:branched-chain amino acid aminotransferase
MENFIFNGKIHKESSGILSPDSRGLRFGDGLFETIKSINGHLEYIDEHFARLWKGMQVLQFDIPKHFNPDHLQQEIINLLKKNQHDKIARIRLTVFRGDGGLYDALNHKPNYIIQSWALPDETGRWNSNGLVAGIYTDVKKSPDILSNLKHNNFLPYAMAALHAKKEKWNDAILLNTGNRLCDTTIANIFLIKEETVYTPALSEGCIAGVIRSNLIEKLTAASYKMVGGILSTEDLLGADEVFFTNSIYNMRWVQRIGDKTYKNNQAQKIFSSFFSTIP